MSCHVICDAIACVVSCHVDAMRCHGDEWLSVVPCNELKMPLVVRSVLLRTTTHYSSSTLYYTVLLQHYPPLQSTTPALLCTTKCHNVLLQYYSVLQRDSPVLLSTTKYYSNTNLYNKVLLRYYSLLQPTTLYYKAPLHYYSFFSMGAARAPRGPGQFDLQSESKKRIQATNVHINGQTD